MQADDYVMCDDCKEKTKDRKALKLHRLPEVLLIMLKRTMYPSTEKDDRHITFPLEASSPSDLQKLTLPDTPSSTLAIRITRTVRMSATYIHQFGVLPIPTAGPFCGRLEDCQAKGAAVRSICVRLTPRQQASGELVSAPSQPASLSSVDWFHQHANTSICMARHREDLLLSRAVVLQGLDFAPYMSEASALEGAGPCTYDLAGVCAHDGKSVNCGHYRAVCR